MQQLVLNFVQRPAMGREDFFVTSQNMEAVAVVDAFPNWSNNVVFIYGDEGCGKTHLVQVFLNKAGANTPVIDVRSFAQEDVPALFAKNGVVVVENVQEIAEQEPLLHLYNYVKENKGFLFCTSQKHPAEIHLSLSDLSSRLLAANIVKIENPDDMFLKVLLVKMFADYQLMVREETLEYALKNMERSFFGAKTLVEKANQISLSRKKPVTTAVLKEVLKKNNLLIKVET